MSLPSPGILAEPFRDAEDPRGESSGTLTVLSTRSNACGAAAN